ncbi:MAG: cyclic nucleotide-binding domain-containing protein [Alphaproteobacteria bacterium]|nr:cyclic nucleotide-binding domain-containing protein [Alphaproteobacteria bacterium]
MSLHEEVDALRRVPLFAKIEPSKLKLLAFTSEKLDYQPGQDLCTQGDAGDAMYIIMAGEADVLINTPSGEHRVARLGKNSFVGEIAILCDVPRTATVRAAGSLTALRISKDLFFRLVGEFPQIAVEIMRELAGRLDRTTKDLAKARAA